MSKLQFIALITPSISSVVLIVLAWVFSNARLSDLRIDMNSQFDAVNRLFEKVDRQFEKVDRRFEKIEQRLDRIDTDLREFNGVTKRLEGRVDELSRG